MMGFVPELLLMLTVLEAGMMRKAIPKMIKLKCVFRLRSASIRLRLPSADQDEAEDTSVAVAKSFGNIYSNSIPAKLERKKIFFFASKYN